MMGTELNKRWILTNSQQRDNGSQLLALTAFQDERIVAHWLLPDGQCRENAIAVTAGAFPSLTPVLPQVSWDEREIHDLFGYIPNGHPDLRPLVRTPRWPDAFYPLRSKFERPIPWLDVEPDNGDQRVTGEGVTIMKVGPTHAGVIESGHFVFSIMGENILHLDLHLFQNHRGVEGHLEGRRLAEVAPLVSRICGADTVSHQVNWASAVEKLAGHTIDQPLAWRRVALLESERILSHLNDLAQIPAGVGFHVAHQQALAMKEKWQRGMHSLFGHRLLFDTVGPGTAAFFDPDALGRLIHDVRRDWQSWRALVLGHHGFQDRMLGVGIVRQADAARLGAQGVVARASGLSFDARSVMPLYQEWKVKPAGEVSGDVAARFKVRLEEVETSWRLLQDVIFELAKMPLPSFWQPPEDLAGDAVAYTESPHGLNAHVVSLKNGQVVRYHVRSGTFRNWPLLTKAVTGNAVGDFPLINKSFELCYSCSDR